MGKVSWTNIWLTVRTVQRNAGAQSQQEVTLSEKGDNLKTTLEPEAPGNNLRWGTEGKKLNRKWTCESQWEGMERAMGRFSDAKDMPASTSAEFRRQSPRAGRNAGLRLLAAAEDVPTQGPMKSHEETGRM